METAAQDTVCGFFSNFLLDLAEDLVYTISDTEYLEKISEFWNQGGLDGTECRISRGISEGAEQIL